MIPILRRDLGREFEESWYLNTNFFIVHTDSGHQIEHWSNFTKEELEEYFSNKKQVILESGLFYSFKSCVLDSRTIFKVQCITSNSRRMWEGYFSKLAYKMSLIKMMREIKKPLVIKILIFSKRESFKKKKFKNFAEGSHLDFLMETPTWQLESMLSDCLDFNRKKDRKKTSK